MANTLSKMMLFIAFYPLIDKGVFLKPLAITDGRGIKKWRR